MRVVSPKRLKDYWEGGNANARPSLEEWLRLAMAAKWNSFASIRIDYPKADQVKVESKKTVYVFNIAGNNHRLIAAIHFNTGVVYLLRIMTHAEYDKNKWKKQL